MDFWVWFWLIWIVIFRYLNNEKKLYGQKKQQQQI